MTSYAPATPSLLRLSFGPPRRETPRNVRHDGLDQGLLRALYRMAREGEQVDLAQLALIMGVCDEASLRPSLRRLLRAGLVHELPGHLALSMAGLAVAAPRPRWEAPGPARARLC